MHEWTGHEQQRTDWQDVASLHPGSQGLSEWLQRFVLPPTQTITGTFTGAW